MTTALEFGRAQAQADMMSKDRARVDKMTFNKLPERERNAINEMYAKENNGRTMVEDGAYSKVYTYQARISGIR